VEALDGQLHTLFTSIDSRAAARNLAGDTDFGKSLLTPTLAHPANRPKAEERGDQQGSPGR
jgi:hypothetical protein